MAKVKTRKARDTSTPEPILSENYSKIQLGIALNWYSTSIDRATSISYLNTYLKDRNLKKDISAAGSTMGSVARLISRGQVTDEKSLKWMSNKVDSLPGKVIDPKVSSPNKVVSIKEATKKKLNQYITGLDHELDDFINLNNFKSDFSVKKYLANMSVKSSYSRGIVGWLNSIKEEFELSKTDEHYKEGYSNFTLAEKNKVIKLIVEWVDTVNTYEAMMKPVRVKKAKSPDKLTLKLKYQKTSVDLKFKMNSESPLNLIEAKEVWTYNTATRMLCYYTSNYGRMSVKGTTLTGFDFGEQRRLRKPEEILPIITKARKGQWVKTFEKNVKTVGTRGTGRFNDTTIILKIFK